MNNISKSSNDKLKIFKGIVVTTSTMSESRASLVSNMILEMGGNFHVDFPKTTNVLVVDIAGLPNYDTILKSKKYQYALTQKLDTIIMDYEMLSMIHNLHKTNQLIKIHPILLGGGNGISVKNDEFLKHIMLNLLRIKYSIKPFDLLKNKVNVFFGKFNSSSEIQKYVKSIKENMTGKKAATLNINEKHYVTQISEEARESCIFITEINSGVRIAAAKKDRVPVVHIQWLKDVVQRNLMISYKPYMLNEITSTDNTYLYDKMMANRCWKNNDLKTLNNDTTLAKQVFDEFEMIDNKIIVKKNLKSKLNNTVWDKIMKANDAPVIPDTVMKRFTFFNDEDNNLQREGTLDQFVVETNYFSNCHILSYGFGDKPNRILYKTFDKLDCSTFKSYFVDYMTKENQGALMETEFKRNFGDQSKRCIIVVPHDMELEHLPPFFRREYLHTLSLFDQNKLNWNYTNTLIVTEFHVERCLFFKKYLDPDCWSLPFFNRDLDFVVYKDVFDTYYWTMSGFEGVEALHMNKIIRLLDSLKRETRFAYSTVLNSSTDLLVVNLAKIMCVQKTQKGALYDSVNRFLNSFKPEEERLVSERETKNMDIDSNSYLIKKLNFIRNSKYPIPSVTPGFIFHMFYQFNKYQFDESGTLSREKHKLIKINDTEWCITCPKKENIAKRGGEGDPFEIKLILEQKENLEDPSEDSRKIQDPLILLNNNFARPEALDISPTKKLNLTPQVKESGSDYESPTRSYNSTSPHKLKKQKISNSPLKTVNGSDSSKETNKEKLGYLFEEKTEGQSSQISYGQKKAPNTAHARLDRVAESDELNQTHHSLLRRSLRKRSTR